MRCPVPIEHRRKILCVFPAYTPSFGTFAHAFPLMLGVRAFMPPQGILLIASYMPPAWDVRFVDENIARAGDADLAWADAVFVSGMHIQAAQIRDIHRRARAAGKVTVLGGSSVSSAPEMYPHYDYLHIGEIGDATDALVQRLDETLAPPPRQIRFETRDRLALADFPVPAYAQIPLGAYLIGSLQFSSGCPYRCEFCDIPALYGRQPRLKTPPQLLAELDALVAQPDHPPVVYVVDDNFIANRKATREMLPHLVAWQKARGYPLQFACEATLNIAKQPEILALMREAGFLTIFAGIETPDYDALKGMDKGHNAALPILQAIEIINGYGIEVTSGIIMGLDQDDDASEDKLIRFIEESRIPILTINLLQALPKTPLWERLEKADRLVDDPRLESNVKFLRGHDDVVTSWRRVIAHAYAPDSLFARFRHQIDHTYGNRLKTPSKGKATAINIKRGAVLMWNIVWQIGVRSDYRGIFWKTFWYALRKGQLEPAIGMAFVAHHLIKFTREALGGEQNASFYANKARPAGHLAVEAEPTQSRAA